MDDLLEELRALRSPLVLYVGAALSQAAGLPSRPQLAAHLLTRLPAETSDARRRALDKLVKAGEFTDTFTELERDLGGARLGLEVERALRDEGVEIPVLGRVLATLQPRVHGVLTPNLDRLLERGFGSSLVTHVRPNMSLVQRPGWLLKLHGTLPDRSTWVLTREQHARVSWRDPLYSRVLGAILLAHHVLFIGTSVDDPIFAEIVAQTRGLSEGTPPRHWALLPKANFDGPTRVKLDDAGISAITYEDKSQLLTMLRSLAPEPSPPPELSRPSNSALPRPTPPRPTLPRPDTPLRILFASANPRDTHSLAVDREQRIIRAALERSQGRERIELVTRVAVSFADLSRTLLEHEFDLVHIASHGEPIGILLDLDGRRRPVPPAQLMALFDEYAPPNGRLCCVLLNSCWSREAARAPSQIPTRITMNGSLEDAAALAFTEGFYDALGAGRDFAHAYREGRRRAEVSTSGGAFDPVLEQGAALPALRSAELAKQSSVEPVDDC